MSNLTNVVIGLVVVGLLLTRQLQARPAKETSSIRIVLILGLIGIFEMKGAIGSHRVTAAPIAWLVLSLLAGAGMGAVRAATVRIWRAEDGSAWRQGTVLTAALWIVSLATHLVLDAVIDHSTAITALGTSSVLVYLAVTLGVQREIVRWRASRLVPGLDPLSDCHAGSSGAPKHSTAGAPQVAPMCRSGAFHPCNRDIGSHRPNQSLCGRSSAASKDWSTSPSNVTLPGQTDCRLICVGDLAGTDGG
jgi:hypothetical protein